MRTHAAIKVIPLAREHTLFVDAHGFVDAYLCCISMRACAHLVDRVVHATG